MTPLKGTIFSRTEGYWSLNKNTSPLQKIKKKKKKKKTGTPPALLSGGFDLAVILIHLINSLWVLHPLKHIKLVTHCLLYCIMHYTLPFPHPTKIHFPPFEIKILIFWLYLTEYFLNFLHARFWRRVHAMLSREKLKFFAITHPSVPFWTTILR